MGPVELRMFYALKALALAPLHRRSLSMAIPAAPEHRAAEEASQLMANPMCLWLTVGR